MEEAIYNRQVAKISMSKRVVDEEQIDRHFARNDLEQLYSIENIEPESSVSSPDDEPSDDVLTQQLIKYKHLIYKYQSHDAFLENNEEEELSPEEMRLAWDEYKCEKTKNMKSQKLLKFPCLEIGNVPIHMQTFLSHVHFS